MSTLHVRIETDWADEGESMRPFIIEALKLAAMKANHVAFSEHHQNVLSDRERELHEYSTCDSSLWLQCCAALSVGPMEFGRFLSERARYTLKWHDKFHAYAKELLELAHRQRAVLYLVGTPNPKLSKVLANLDPNIVGYKWQEDPNEEQRA